MKINIKKKLKSAGSTIKGMGSIDKKSLKNGSYSMGITAIVIAVLVVINLIVGQIPEKYTQVDVSTQKLYTISDTTVKYLKDMNTDVTIYHIVQSGKEDSVLEKMLIRYEEESKHIKVEKKDPVLYPNFTSQYTSDDVADNSLIVVAGEKSKVISYSDLYETEQKAHKTLADACAGSCAVCGVLHHLCAGAARHYHAAGAHLRPGGSCAFPRMLEPAPGGA